MGNIDVTPLNSVENTIIDMVKGSKERDTAKIVVTTERPIGIALTMAKDRDSTGNKGSMGNTEVLVLLTKTTRLKEVP